MILNTFACLFKKMYICIMLMSFKYRIFPTTEQSGLLNRHIGASRFVYNLALETKQMAWIGSRINISCFDLHRQLKDLKKECEWLRDVNSQSLQQSITNLDKAYTCFLRGRNNFPTFKKKSNSGSFNIPQHVSLSCNKLFIPKFREGIAIVLHRPIRGTIRQATISRTPTDKYFVSILCETGEDKPIKAAIKEDTTIGIDLGIKTYLVTSDGQEFENPKYLRRSQNKLKYIQRKYSNNKGVRTRRKLAKLHERVANQRKDFLHKVSTRLIRENQSIAIERLNISGILKNHCLAQSVSDAAWGMFVSMLEYKAEWYGKNILKIGRFDPSSKTCSACGVVNKDLRLRDREWTCACGASHNRDINAACNIKTFALKNHVFGTKTQTRNELPTLVGVMTSEALSAPCGCGGGS